MDRFAGIKNDLIALAEASEDILALIAIGSQTRTVEAADEYSDLDVVLVTEAPELYLYSDERISRIGDVKISFVEPTIGGGLERRFLLEGSLDVDLIVLTPDQYSGMLDSHFADCIFGRGYSVLYDSAELTCRLSDIRTDAHIITAMDSGEFANLTGDFWFHTVWAAKKICRGELWTAKMCVDSYLKVHLRRMIELYHISLYGKGRDVWHEGRMMERWADEDVLRDLAKCFARFDADEIADALRNTAALFGRLAAKSAGLNGYDYPVRAEQYAKQQLTELLG